MFVSRGEASGASSRGPGHSLCRYHLCNLQLEYWGYYKYGLKTFAMLLKPSKLQQNNIAPVAVPLPASVPVPRAIPPQRTNTNTCAHARPRPHPRPPPIPIAVAAIIPIRVQTSNYVFVRGQLQHFAARRKHSSNTSRLAEATPPEGRAGSINSGDTPFLLHKIVWGIAV